MGLCRVTGLNSYLRTFCTLVTFHDYILVSLPGGDPFVETLLSAIKALSTCLVWTLEAQFCFFQ